MSEGPLVSVCMPSYNYASYLETSIRSVFAQSYRPLELIIVDDGSTDDSAAVIERVTRDAPIPVRTVMGSHGGVSAALNLALSAAKGDWICILAADDVSRPERVERLINAASGPAVVLVHSEYTCIDTDGSPTLYDSSTDLPPAQGRALRSLLELKADVRSMTVMLKRSAMPSVPYDPSLPAEDWQSILRLARAGSIAHVPEPLVERRIHQRSASFSVHRNQKTFSFTEVGIDVLKEVCPPDLPLDRVIALHTAVVLRNALALGAFEKVWDGLRQGFEAIPTQRAFLARETLRGLTSYVWIHGMQNRLPKPAVRALLRLKGQMIRSRIGSSQS